MGLSRDSDSVLTFVKDTDCQFGLRSFQHAVINTFPPAHSCAGRVKDNTGDEPDGIVQDLEIRRRSVRTGFRDAEFGVAEFEGIRKSKVVFLRADITRKTKGVALCKGFIQNRCQIGFRAVCDIACNGVTALDAGEDIPDPRVDRGIRLRPDFRGSAFLAASMDLRSAFRCSAVPSTFFVDERSSGFVIWCFLRSAEPYRTIIKVYVTVCFSEYNRKVTTGVPTPSACFRSPILQSVDKP